jgi:hypothetical protein
VTGTVPLAFPLMMCAHEHAPGWSHPWLSGEGLGARVGTTASCVAPGSDGLVVNRGALQLGTAVHATQGSGSAPDSATPARSASSRSGATDASPGRRAGAGRPEPGNGAPTGRAPDQTGVMGPARRPDRNDPKYRLLMAVLAAMNNRYCRS